MRKDDAVISLNWGWCGWSCRVGNDATAPASLVRLVGLEPEGFRLVSPQHLPRPLPMCRSVVPTTPTVRVSNATSGRRWGPVPD